MIATKTELTEVYAATWDWLEVVEKQGCKINWDANPIGGDEWDAACEACEFDAADSDVGFGLLIEPRECDTILRAGDIVAVQGYGGDVAFLRRI